MTELDLMMILASLVSASLRLAVIIPVMFYVLRRLDKRNNMDFSAWWNDRASPGDQCRYLCWRLAVVGAVVCITLS